MLKDSHAQLTWLVREQLQAKSLREVHPIKSKNDFTTIIQNLQAKTAPILKERIEFFEELKEKVREQDFEFHSSDGAFYTNIKVGDETYSVNSWEKDQLNQLREEETRKQPDITQVFRMRETLEQFPNHMEIVIDTPTGYEIVRNAHFEIVTPDKEQGKYLKANKNTPEKDRKLVVRITTDPYIEETND